MADVFLHIGLNKTGTSSIQDFMRMNAAALLAEGVCYPATLRQPVAHHELSFWIKKLAPEVDPAGTPEGQALRTEMAAARTVVISSEDFHTLSPKAVRQLARLLDGHRVQVVLYVREHVAYLASWYQQNVQASHLSCAFDTFCHLTSKPLHTIAERWAEVFGRRNVQVGLYDRASLDGGDIVRDFARRTGIGGDLGRFARKPYESNPSVAGNLLFAKRLINNLLDKQAAATMTDEITALSALKPEFRGAMAVDPVVAGYVSRMYAQDRLKFEKLYGLEIAPAAAERAGRLTPDFATLADDWALLSRAADQRGMVIGRYLRMVALADLTSLATPPVSSPEAVGQ